MLPRRIILEGRGFIKVDNSLPHLKYVKLPSQFVKKHLSDEAIIPVGVAPLVVTKKVRVEREGADKPVHTDADTNMLCLEFKWDLQSLIENPELFVKYFNYFENTPQDGAKATTTEDFMPFVNDKLYAKMFADYIANAEATASQYELDVLNEATATKKKSKKSDEGKKEALNTLPSDLAGFTEDEDDELLVDDTANDVLGAVGDVAVEDGDIDTAGVPQTVIGKDANGNDETISSEVYDNVGNVKAKTQEYKFYLVFEYSNKYNHAETAKNGSHSTGDGISIDMLVSETHIENPNISISGRQLKKRSPGFNSEIMGIISRNYTVITKTATSPATIDEQPDGAVEIVEDPILPHEDVGSDSDAADYVGDDLDYTSGNPVDDVVDDNPSDAIDEYKVDPTVEDFANTNKALDISNRMGKVESVDESEEAFRRFKSHGKVGV